MNKLNIDQNPSCKFLKQGRLLCQKEFQVVFNNNTAKSADNSWLMLAKTNNLGFCRLGLVISKKISKKAVVRNRLKRIVRESFRQKENFGEKGLDIVILGRRETAIQENRVLFRSLDKHWNRLVKRISKA